MKKKIENKVVDTVLERAVNRVSVGEREYDVAPATLATIMLVSEKIASMPAMCTALENDGQRITEALRIAKESYVLAEICAITILGAEKESKCRFRHRGRRDYSRKVEKLAGEISYSWSPTAIRDHIVKSLIDLELLDFFTLPLPYTK